MQGVQHVKPQVRLCRATSGTSTEVSRHASAGARLTAYELVQEGLSATLIADSAAGALMAAGKVDAVVVGADRIAANGDTANKIGTYSLAVNAKQHGCGFICCVPRHPAVTATEWLGRILDTLRAMPSVL